MPNKDVFEFKNVTKSFGHGKDVTVAVKNLDLAIKDQEIVTVVGGSACGKSVFGKLLLGLLKPTQGELLFRGEPIGDQIEHWQEVQMVFQDPFTCFNQFLPIRRQLEASFGVFKGKKPSAKEIKRRVDEGLMAVNMKPQEIEDKYPFELSGGQMQRMLLARIFALRPKVLVADEPTSMVDACVRAGILDYLLKLKDELDMTIVFITHDIGLAYYVSDRIFIMHDGEVVEAGDPDQVAFSPKNPHTIQLLEDIPEIHREWIQR
ncbi:ABC transporter ATP-binding protein [Chitinivibrio alkaliphilus]|uniref:ABC-type dipeptide/oligopeptide/nickel transport system, ATPase componen n=1 Tax=Chitinivibrio alkaliphilus ACht1 TaxID=1313304 RepID=U7D9B2_9BACT|nr:ABC transporter ATP-binding protein [Chitinivibrio alkaliphilus]ERP32171.1 ABC-type dipeptide/oligopeptide/nickel transport system, ATPase componen [Chitinivibrio alkaliphilus ACht1]